MQSFLQYKRAGSAAQTQINRDLAKANGKKNMRKDMDKENLSKLPGQSPEEDLEVKKQTTEEKSSLAMDRLELSDDDNEEIEEISSPAERSRTTDTIKTHYSEGTALGHALTGVHVRERRSHAGPGSLVFVVDWESPEDPLCPRNWTTWRRVGVTMQISVIAFFLTAASSIDATVLPQAARDFHVSEVAESLATGTLCLPSWPYTQPKP